MAFLNIPPKDNSTPLTAVEFNYLVDKLNARQLNDLIDVQSDDAVDKNIIQHNGSGWVFAKITDNHFTKTEIIALINGVDVSIPVDTYIERFFITDGTTINTINNADTITFNSSQFTINPTTGEIELDAVGNASDWDTAYDKNILSIAVTGTTTKTITLTQRDGSTLTGTFQDLSGAGGDGNDFLTSGSFNDTDGVITLNVANQSPVTVDIDGRFSLIGHDHVISDITGLQSALDGKVDDAQVLTDVPANALFTDTIYDDTAIQAEVDLNTVKVGVTAQMVSDIDTNTLKVGITPAQAQDIVDNNAKVSNVDHPLVETAVPVGAVFTDTIYNDAALQAAVALNTLKETNIAHPLVEKAVPSNALFTDTQLSQAQVGIFATSEGFIKIGSVNNSIANLLTLNNTWTGENTFNEDTRFLNEIFVTGDVTTDNAHVGDSVQFTLGAGSINLSRTVTTDVNNYFLKLPRANGQLAVSVQGNTADANGNIVVPNMVLKDSFNAFTNGNRFQDETVFSGDVLVEGINGISLEGVGKVTDMLDGTNAGDAVNKGQMDAAISVIDNRYLRSDVDTTKTAGNLRMATGVPLYFGTTIQGLLQTNGASEIMMNLINSNFVIRNNSANRITFDRSSGSITTVGAFIGTGTGDSRVAGGLAVGDYSYTPRAKLTVTDYTAGTNNVAFFKGQATTEGDATTISINNGYSLEYSKEVKIGAVSESSSSNLTGMALYTSPNSSGSLERVRISNAGNVGIGTTSPDSKLHVYANNDNAPTVLTIENGDLGVVAGQDLSKIEFLTNDESSPGAGVAASIRTVCQNAGNIFDLAFNTQNGTTRTERMRLTGVGNLGIGTTSPDGKLHIDGITSTIAGLVLEASESSAFNKLIEIQNTGGSKRFGIEYDNTSVRLKITDRSGNIIASFIEGTKNVGIGTTSPSYKLDIRSDGGVSRQLHVGDADGVMSMGGNNLGQFIINGGRNSVGNYATTHGTNISGLNGSLYFGSISGVTAGTTFNPTNRMTIHASGNVSINNTNNTYKLDVSGTGRFTSTVTATNFILSSDERLKENIQDFDYEQYIKMDVKTYELKSEKGIKRTGVIAQELEVNHPEFVRTDEEGMKSVAYTDLLMAKVAELEARLEKAGI